MFKARADKNLILIIRQFSFLIDKGETKESAFAKLESSLSASQVNELHILKQLFDADNDTVVMPILNAPMNILQQLIKPVRQHGGDLIDLFSAFHKTFLQQDNSHYIKNYDTSGIIAYLISLILMASLVLTIYAVSVFPSIRELFDEYGNVVLPANSQFIFTLLIDWGLLLAAIVLVILVFFFITATKIKNSVANLQFFDNWLLRLPGFKNLSQQYNLYLSLRFIQIIVHSGVNSENAKNIVYAMLDTANIKLDKQLYSIKNKLHQQHLTEPLVLADKLDNLQNEIHYQIETLYEKSITDFSKLKDSISFIAIIIVAAIIGNLIIAMYMPIFMMGKIVGA